MELKLLKNPGNPETEGAKHWVEQMIRHLSNPENQEALDYLKRQYDADTNGRPKPVDVLSISAQSKR